MGKRISVQERPAEAPVPKMWKSLGFVYPQLQAAYALASGLQSDLDVDREAELRDEMRGMLATLINDARCDVANTTFVRYATKSLPELVIRYMAVYTDDRYPN